MTFSVTCKSDLTKMSISLWVTVGSVPQGQTNQDVNMLEITSYGENDWLLSHFEVR